MIRKQPSANSIPWSREYTSRIPAINPLASVSWAMERPGPCGAAVIGNVFKLPLCLGRFDIAADRAPGPPVCVDLKTCPIRREDMSDRRAVTDPDAGPVIAGPFPPARPVIWALERGSGRANPDEAVAGDGQPLHACSDSAPELRSGMPGRVSGAASGLFA